MKKNMMELTNDEAQSISNALDLLIKEKQLKVIEFEKNPDGWFQFTAGRYKDYIKNLEVLNDRFREIYWNSSYAGCTGVGGLGLAMPKRAGEK